MRIHTTRKIIMLAAALAVAQPVLAHNDGAYNHDYAAVANKADWMAGVNGSRKVSELSLPGTHDTMSIKAGDIWQNQTMTLTQQLNSGLRVFDMRTRHINNSLRMHHGSIAQDTYFNDVLVAINNFLAAHPTETVLFRLKEEHDAENNTRSYNETLNAYLAANGSKRYTGSNDNPTLNEIRGKFVILQDFSGGAGNYGIPYYNLNKQDNYSLGNNWDLHGKWEAVKNQLNNAKNGDSNTIYMNYLSGAVGSFPYFVASGHSSNGTSAPRLATGLTTPANNSSYPDFPRVDCFIGICTIAFEGTNVLAANHIANGGRTGMVMADFPGERLITNIINQNDFSSVYAELRAGNSGLCLDVYGGYTANRTNVQLWTCHGGPGQMWWYDAANGFLRNKLGTCLDNTAQAYNGGRLQTWECVDSNNLRFDWVGNSLRSRHNNNIAVDAFGSTSGSTVGQWTAHGGTNQQWNWAK